jgi:lipoyl(octanoyl) transferase
MTTSVVAAPLEVYLLGLIDFDQAQMLQKRLVYDRGERPGGAVVLCEHPPTISVGRLGSRAHIRADDDELRARGIPIRWVNRGGGCQLHVPGQLSVYAILPLLELGLGLASYLDGLQRAALGVLEEFDLGRGARARGGSVLLGDERVGAIGVAVRRWIAYHGFTLNVGPFLAPFQLLDDSTALDGASGWTSMEARRQRPASMARVREAVIRRLEEAFGLERHVVFTSHPMLRREPLTHVYAPSPR